MYITNDADFQHGVINPRKCALRVAGNKLAADGGDIFAAVGKQVQRVEGGELFKQAHFGPEASLYTNSLVAGAKTVVDLRELFGPLYNSADIMKKLGLHEHVPGIRNEDGVDAPALFSRVEFKQMETEIASGAIGIHGMAAIAIVALAGSITYHPSVTQNFAQNAVGMLLRCVPSSFTPGNLTKILNFDTETVMNRNIRVEATDRPAYLPRPANDPAFMSSGIYTLGPVIMTKTPMDSIGEDVVFGMLPEHCTHNDGLLRYASMLKCDVMDLPIKEIPVYIWCFFVMYVVLF